MTETYTVVLRAEPEGGFTVLVPALPEVVSYGATLAEARRMAAEAIALAVEVRQERGETFAEGESVLVPQEEYTGDLHILRLTVALPELSVAHA